MDYLFDPTTQVGNPALLLLERVFYGGLAIFLFGALSTAIKRGLKDKRKAAIDSGQDLYERTFYEGVDLNDGNSYTRLSSFYIRFDIVGQIGEKPKFIERLSFMDFIQLSRVPFYELSLQYISSLNMITGLNINVTDDIGISISSLSKNSSLKGNWMPDAKFWFGINYRANF